MPYELQLPDGSVVEVPDSITPEQARQNMLHSFPDQFPARKSGFMPALKAGFTSGVGATEKFGSQVAKEAGLPSAAAWLSEKAKANEQQAAGQFDPTTSADKGAMARVRQYLTEPAGGMVGAMGPAVAAGAAGTMLGGPLAGTAAFMAPMTAQESGMNLQRQEQQQQDPNLLKATSVGLVQAALDRFGFGRLMSGFGAQKIAMDAAAKLAPQVLSGQITREAAMATLGGTIKNIGIETGLSAATNTGIGVANEAMRRGQADQPLADQEALDTYKHTAISAAALAPFLGAAHGVNVRGRADGMLGAEAKRGVQQREDIKLEQMDYPGYQKMQADEAATTAEASKPRLLENKPEPLISFPDGTVGTRQDVDAYVRGLPEQEQGATRARLMGMGEKPIEPPVEQAAASGEPSVMPPVAAKPVVPAAPTNLNITTPETFASMIYPRSPTWKKGELFGKDLTNEKDVSSIIKTLSKYGRNLEDSEANAPRIAAIDAKLEELQAMRTDLRANSKATEVPNVSNSVDKVHAGVDAPANLGNMGVGEKLSALPEQLPHAERGGIGSGNEVAGGNLQREGAQPVAIAPTVHAPLPPTPSLHYSKVADLPSLSGDYNGTGIKGAEAARLAHATDPRIKQRAYFYNMPVDGSLPRAEGGLGSHMYESTHSNLYDLAKDPANIAAKIKGITDPGEKANAMESVMIDAGYDGYSARGMIVRFGNDVPVKYKGDKNAAATGVPRPSDTGTGRVGEQPPAVRTESVEPTAARTEEKVSGDYGRGTEQLRGVEVAGHKVDATEWKAPDSERTYLELEGANGARAFSSAIAKATEAHKSGASVYVYPEQEYAGMRMFVTKDGKGGVAVKPDGDIVFVFNAPDGERGMTASSLKLAVANGGKKLDAFDTVLPGLYAKSNFTVRARLKWDDSQAPAGWDKAEFKRFNNGEPDVVFMTHDPERAGRPYVAGEGKLVASYDEAVRLQNAALSDAPATVRSAVDAGDYSGVAKALREDPNPIVAKIGEIASGIKGVKIEVNPKATDQYNPATRTITISDPAKTNVVAHEMAHSITQTALEHPTKAQAPIVEGINNLFKSVRAKLSNDAPYAIKNVHEFVAEAFSNKEFQNTLAKMKYANTTAWGRFTEYVAKLLGLKKDNALTEFLSLSEELHKTGLKAKTDATAGALYAEKQRENILARLARKEAFVRADILANRLAGGKNETISARVGKAKETSRVAAMLARRLDAIDPGHTDRAIENSMKERMLGVKKVSPPVAEDLGTYKNSATPESEAGLLERGVRGATSGIRTAIKLPGADKSVIMQKISDAAYRIEQGMFDINRGVTRYLDGSATHIAGGRREATAAALMQHSTYAIQIARESMTRGGIEKNAEGMFHVVDNAKDNFHTLSQAIELLPAGTGKDKFRVANGILTNLSYWERESQLAAKKAQSLKLERSAKADLKEAQSLTGNKAAAAISKANGQIRLARSQLDVNYKRPASITDETIAQARADLANHPEVQKLVDIARNINMQHLKTLEEGGTISKEAADTWRENKHYIPLQREMNEDIALGIFSKVGGTNTRDIKSFKSSEREIHDAVGNLIRQRLYVADTAMRNNASLHALKELEQNGFSGVTKIDHKPLGATDVVTVKDNGERQFYKVTDKNALRTFQGLVEQVPGFVNAMEKVTQVFREMIMLSPDAIFRNVSRDVTDSWAYNYTNKSLAGTAKDVVLQFAKAMPSVAREAVGGEVHRPRYSVSAFGITGKREYTSLMREKESIIREQMSGANPNDWAGYADRALGAAYHAWQNVATEAELATRNRVFHETLKRTGSETEATLASINTMDFRRRGSWEAITYAKKLVPFFNSNLQGVYKLYRAVARNDNMGTNSANARKALGIKIFQMAAAASAYQLLMSGDEDYQQASKMNTDNAWLVPLGDKQFLKIPINFELGALAFTTPTNIIRTMIGDQSGRELVNSLKSALGHQFPGIIPQAIKPVLEGAFNYNSFTGKPIESETMRRLDPQERKTDSTSSVAKALAAGKVSPVMADHLLRGYLGSIGTFAISVVDSAVDANANKPEKPLSKAPFIRSLVTDPLQSRYVDKFYDINGLTTQVATTVRKLISEGKEEEARAYMNKVGPTGVQNAQLYALNDSMASIATMMTNMRKMERQIANSTLSPREKRVKIEEIKVKVNDAIKQAMPHLSKAAGE